MPSIPVGSGITDVPLMVSSLTPLWWFILAVLCGTFVILLYTARRRARRRATVRCPIARRPARVVVRLAADGVAMDVLTCSLLGARARVTCAKACLPLAASR